MNTTAVCTNIVLEYLLSTVVKVFVSHASLTREYIFKLLKCSTQAQSCTKVNPEVLDGNCNANTLY